MQYLGGKFRLVKKLLPVMLAEKTADQCWVEPFVGGANVFTRIRGDKIGSDSHKYLISLLKAVQQGWVLSLKIFPVLYTIK